MKGNSMKFPNVMDMVRHIATEEDWSDLELQLQRRRLIKSLMAITAARGCTDADIYKSLNLDHPQVRKLECGYDSDLTVANVQGYLDAAGVQIDVVELILNAVNQQLTPTNDELKKLAKRFPPPPEWLAAEEEKPW